jgi:CDGSH-type Zn-finger protein
MSDRPKCGCGNTSNEDGYCDGSHMNIIKEEEN